MFDAHFHSDTSYCTEGGMSLDFIAETVKKKQLDGIAVTDHSFAIYFPEDIAWSWEYMSDSSVFDKFRERGDKNMDAYLTALENLEKEKIVPGIETETMHDGRFTFSPEFRSRIKLLIGSIHYLPKTINASADTIMDEWLKNTYQLLDSDIDILGHPFRWIAQKMPGSVSEQLIDDIVKTAKTNNIALEINSHFKIDTDRLMMKKIMKYNAKVVFSTDSHRRSQAGDFSYHLNLLDQMNIPPDSLNIRQIP